MSDTPSFDFGKFVPGFDFLQGLTKGVGGTPAMPTVSNWVAPTLDVAELERRVQELKAVLFWLEQNSRALAATIQAMEVQKMTLATLKDMNVRMEDVAHSFQNPVNAMMAQAQKATQVMTDAAQAFVAKSAKPGKEKSGAEAAAGGKNAFGFDPANPWAAFTDAAKAAAAQAQPFVKAATGESTSAAAQAASAAGEAAAAHNAASGKAVDPMQWWNALSTQFQHIASQAVQDASARAEQMSRTMASQAEAAQKASANAMQSATDKVTAAATKAAETAASAFKMGAGNVEHALKPAPAKTTAKAPAKKAGATRARASVAKKPQATGSKATATKKVVRKPR